MSSPIRRPSPHRRSEAAAPTRSPRSRSTEPPFNPRSWGGALVVMCAVAALLWVIQIANAADDYGFNAYGLKPRDVSGLWGLVTMPFLHASYAHMLSNTIPLIAIGWVVLLSGLRTWLTVTAIVVVGGGLLTWIIGPDGTVVGASGMIFGWLGYLLARAYFARTFKWIVVAVLVLVFFGSLLLGLFPTLHSEASWQVHLAGFAAGVGAGALLHPRGGQTRRLRRPVVS